MIDLNNLGKYRKSRVWFSDIPSCTTVTSKIKDVVVSNQQPLSISVTEVAVELYYPRNASNYGMLGLNYIPEKSETLEISVEFFSEKSEVFKDSLVADFDKVYLGIPKEFSDLILRTAEKVVSSSETGLFGRLEFKYGASADAGSSPIVFTKLTEILIGIICKRLTEKDDLQNYISEKM